MEKKTEFIIDMLTKDSVSIVKKQYFEIGGKRYYDDNERNSYVNDECDIQLLRNAVPDYIFNAVMEVWNS